LSDKPRSEIFIKKFSESLSLGFGKGVDLSWRKRSAFFEIDVQVVWSMWGKGVGSVLAENVGKFVILFWDVGKVHGGINGACSSRGGFQSEIQCKQLGATDLQAQENATVLTKETLGGVIFARGGGIGSIETIALMAEVTISEIGDGRSVEEELSVFGVGSGASIVLARSDVGVGT
jgi:hypothetical protein